MRSITLCRKVAPPLMALIILAMMGATARADDLIVKYDQSQILHLPGPAADLIIGNASIVDVAVQSSNTLVVTGKSFGITNVIALDSQRNVIREQRVIVVRDEMRVVNVQKGAKRESYNCTPQCNPSLVVGDDKAYFEGVATAAERKIKFSSGQSDHSNQQQQ
jgi:Flp pilus assembly secretin CpaC